MKTVILIKGKARSGKSTFARLLQEYLDTDTKYLSRMIGNGDAVKDIAVNSFNWNLEKDEAGRQLLLDVTQAGYNYDKNFWERETFNTINVYYSKTDIVIIPDWRYESTLNYFSSLKDVEVFTVHVMNSNRESIGNLASHSSETELNEVVTDFNVHNHGVSKKEYKEDIIKIAKLIVEDIEEA